MTHKRRPGRVPPRHRPEQSINSGEITLKPDANLAVETVLKSMPAREDEIRPKVLRQLHGTPATHSRLHPGSFSSSWQRRQRQSGANAWRTN